MKLGCGFLLLVTAVVVSHHVAMKVATKSEILLYLVLFCGVEGHWVDLQATCNMTKRAQDSQSWLTSSIASYLSLATRVCIQLRAKLILNSLYK